LGVFGFVLGVLPFFFFFFFFFCWYDKYVKLTLVASQTTSQVNVY